MKYQHGSLDAQAVTDLVSNVTTLASAAQVEDPRPWLAFATAGHEQLSVFLHEATHHWCFTSPVAFAIAAIVLRARLETVRAIENNTRPPDSIIVDIVRADTATALLRPLAEGLALFAEFDVVSRMRSRAVSPVLTALMQFFVNLRESADLYQSLPGELATAETINRVLLRLRTDPNTLNRKASLLLKPLALKAGGYLPGYLAVKSLWRAACRRDFRLANETDLFLMYFRSFIYDDWGLVACLLRPSDNEIQSAEDIVNHINSRLQQWENLSSQEVIAYEDYLLGDKRVREVPGIMLESGLVSEGRELLNALERGLTAKIEDAPVISAIAAWHVSMLMRRHFMNLVSASVQVRVIQGGIVQIGWEGTPILELSQADLVQKAAPVPGDASLEVVFTFRQDRFDRAIVVHRNGEIMACKAIGLEQHAAETRDNVIATFRERPKLQAFEKHMHTIMEDIVRQSWFSIPVEHCRSQIAGLVDSFYRDTALRFARSYDAIDQCAEAMADRGFKTILGGSGKLTRGLALLGLVTSLNPASAFVEKQFQNAGLDLKATLKDLQSAYEEHGYPPKIFQDGESIFTTV